MRSFLIPLFLLVGVSLFSQEPMSVEFPKFGTPSSLGADMPCNDAGTFQLGQFIGQSNDFGGPQIFLCRNDSIFIDHDGNASFAIDPTSAAFPPGIAYGFYRCQPTVDGPTLALIDADPCIVNDISTGNFYIANGLANGDIWFRNSGSLNSNPVFGGNMTNPQPVELFYAPITVYDFKETQPWGAGATAGDNCVAVSVDEAVSVVYLTPITISATAATIASGCKGTYIPSGGFFEWDNNSTYQIDITGIDNPAAPTHKLFEFKPGQSGNQLTFSVEENGRYLISASDGKSCAGEQIVEFTGCNVADNIGLSTPDMTVFPSQQVCIPVIYDQAHDMTGMQFSLTWDQSVLAYDSYSAPNTAVLTSVNNFQTANEIFSALIELNGTATLPFTQGDTIIELCFNVVGNIGDCTSLQIVGTPTEVSATSTNGSTYGFSIDNGTVCVTSPGALDMDIQLGVLNCDGSGEIVIIPSGGIAPYEIIYSGPSGVGGTINPNVMLGDSAIINATVSGNYTITVTDANGVGTSYSEMFNANLPKYVANFIRTSPKCFGGMDGSIEVEISLNNVIVPNTNSEFSFQWTGPAGVVLSDPTGPVQTGMPGGAYSVTVTNNDLDCVIAPASGGLTEPPMLMRDNLVLSPASCSGNPDGSFMYSVKGGTKLTQNTYRYTLNFSASGTPPGTNLVTNSQVAGLNRTNALSGTYITTITDANGCTFTDEFFLPAQKELSLDLITQTDVSCFGLADGTIALEVSTNPITVSTYVFSVVGGSAGITQTPNAAMDGTVFDNVPAGMYTIFATENGTGCRAEGIYTINAPSELILGEVSLQNPSCALGSDGRIEVLASGGTPGVNPMYTYVWTPTHSGNINAGLSPGNYEVTATDARGCKDSLTFDLALPPPPSIMFDSVSVKCGEDGCLSVIATPTPPATIAAYQWLDMATGLDVGTTDEICGLSGGMFQLVVVDNASCTNIDTVSLHTPDLIKIDMVNSQLPRCFGNADGIVGVTVSGGQPNYDYTWAGSTVNGSALTGITSGTYLVTITDAVGCTKDTTITLGDPAPILSSALNLTGTTCSNTMDGGVTLLVNYGSIPVTSANFAYQWSTTTSMDSIVTDLPSGLNFVTISDPMNCFIIDTIDVPSPSPVNGTTSYSLPVKCFGGADGVAFADAMGGNGAPYSFLWDNGTTDNIRPNLSVGAYVVTISDVNGCTGIQTVDVFQPDPIMAIDSTIDVICANDNNGEIHIIVTGGNVSGGYTYTWDNGIGNGPSLFDVGPGTYRVTITDIEGCTGETSVTMNNPLPVSGSYLAWDPLICNGDQTTLFVDTIFGGVGGPYQFTLDYGVELPVDFPVSMGGGWHVVSYIDRVGCMSEDSIFVDEPQQITVTFPVDVIEVELGDTTYQLLPTVNPPDIAAFSWTNGEFLSNPDTLRPYAYNNESQTFTLMVTNSDGCMGEGSITVEIDPNRNIYIPNIFNPGSTNGFNDHFTPYSGFGVTEVELMQVFDRWGALVFERTNFVPNNNDYSEGWDGTYKGKKAGVGVYVYVVKVLFRDGRRLTYRGDVTLIR